MENFENSIPSAPVRRRVATQPPVNAQPQAINNKKGEGLHNPKLLTLILLCLACVGLVCFFLVPVYFDKVKILGETVKIKLFEFLSEKGVVKVASSLILVGYSVVIFNSLVNLWHEKKVSMKGLFVVCNFIAVIASLTILICGFYLIFGLGYTPISLITLSVLVSLFVIQAIAFLRCKVLKEKIKELYVNNKKLTIVGIVLLLVFAILTVIQLFFCDGIEYVSRTVKVWVDAGIHGYYETQMIQDEVHTICQDMVVRTNLGYTLFFASLVLLVFHIFNNVLLLVSKRVQVSKYGFVSKVVLAVLSVLYLIFSIFAIIKINNYYDAFMLYIILASVVATAIAVISILQAVKSKSKK